jgi:uncharacterized SAM-binding protein YcdF (DUF218 family)
MKKTIYILIAVFLLLGSIYFAFPFVLNGVAGYLVVQDKLEPADAIIVLGGDWSGERVEQGVALYKQGFARYIIMTGGKVYRTLTNAQLMREHAREKGVPGRAIILEDKTMSTKEDARFSLPILNKHNIKSIILVTSPYHTRRAGMVFKRNLEPRGIKVMVCPAREGSYNPQRWWTRHEDTELVVKECVSLVLYWIKRY